MNQPISDTTIITAVSGRFPELLDDLTSFGWLWVKAAVGVLKIETEQQLAEFVVALAKNYRHFPEIPDCRERLFFALAAQSCYLEMIGKALAVARDACELPASFTLWRQSGSLPGKWQTWRFTRSYLSHPVCLTHGQFPDQLGLTGYIIKVEQRYLRMLEPAGAV